MTQNKSVLEWVGKMKELVCPDNILWIDGSEAQIEALRAEACKTGEFIKPVILRHAGGVFVAQAPLANQTRIIARLLQEVGYGSVLRPQGLAAVAANPSMAGVQARHQRAA